MYSESEPTSPSFVRAHTSNGASMSKREEELINSYEAEEERIINILSRKLEQVRGCCGAVQLLLNSSAIYSS